MAAILSIPAWASINKWASKNLNDIKGQHTFLFDRVPGLLGDTQTPFETNCSLHATSEKKMTTINHREHNKLFLHFLP